MCRSGGEKRRTAWLGLLAAVVAAAGARPHAQLGSLISPGPLAAPHAKLEGAANCTKCHEQGRKVTAQKCLACHQPVAERIARKIGVHRNVTADCVSCHSEHAGVNGVLRPFDPARFDHSQSGFPLDGRHGAVAQKCDSCHKTRSFLTAKTECAACHADVHKGSLGPNCASCHSTRTPFRELSGQFDHARSAFPLLGAHRTVACAQCHPNKTFKGLKFANCTDCHKDPHGQAFGLACRTCHSNDNWRTTKVDHTRTPFPLKGRHAAVPCAGCHKQPPMKVRLPAGTCATCHVDIHRGAFQKDCSACHSESGFKNTPFDHAKTALPLTGKHQGLPCNKCHTNVTTRTADFRGLSTACAGCHKDVHQGELGPRCDTCHSAATFRVTAYTHPRFPEFFGGAHGAVTCGQCHPRGGKYTNTSTTCSACHQDVHLGQLGTQCQTCHSIAGPKFAPASFSHASSTFALTGKHTGVECAKCHRRETAVFPAGQGTAVRYKGIDPQCRACHADLHLGQFNEPCAVCHTTATFKRPEYTHRAPPVRGFFAGRHLKATCGACHKPSTGMFPAGAGTAVRFRIDSACATCHTDVHRGSLGKNCIECHRP